MSNVNEFSNDPSSATINNTATPPINSSRPSTMAETSGEENVASVTLDTAPAVSSAAVPTAPASLMSSIPVSNLTAPQQLPRRSSSRIAGSHLSRAGSLSLDTAFSVLDAFTLAQTLDDNEYSNYRRQRNRSKKATGQSTSSRSSSSGGRTRPRPSSTVGTADVSADHGPQLEGMASNADSHRGITEEPTNNAQEGEEEQGGVQRKRVRHEERPRWQTQTYMLVQALRRNPRGECARTELIKSAIEIDAEVARERGLPRVFRGKTPVNSASACLTMNKDKMFIAFKPPGARSTHFRLAFEPGNFDYARQCYLRWIDTLTQHDWPICFGKLKETSRWKLDTVWQPKHEYTFEELERKKEAEEQRQQREKEEQQAKEQAVIIKHITEPIKEQNNCHSSDISTIANIAVTDKQANTVDECNSTVNPSHGIATNTTIEQPKSSPIVDKSIHDDALSSVTALALLEMANGLNTRSYLEESCNGSTNIDSNLLETTSTTEEAAKTEIAATDTATTSTTATSSTASKLQIRPIKLSPREQRAWSERAWAFRNIDITYNPALQVMPAACDPSYRQWTIPKWKQSVISTTTPSPMYPAKTRDVQSSNEHSGIQSTINNVANSSEDQLSVDNDGDTSMAGIEIPFDNNIINNTVESVNSMNIDNTDSLAISNQSTIATTKTLPSNNTNGDTAINTINSSTATNDTIYNKMDTLTNTRITLEDIESVEHPNQLSDVVYVADSTIPNAGRGLFATRHLPPWTPIGFYFGVPMTEDEFDMMKDGVGLSSHYSIMYRRTVLDATDNEGQPWTDPEALASGGMYCPFHFMNEDVMRGNVAFLEGSEVNQVICMTTKPVLKDEELFAYYGGEVDRHWANANASTTNTATKEEEFKGTLESNTMAEMATDNPVAIADIATTATATPIVSTTPIVTAIHESTNSSSLVIDQNTSNNTIMREEPVNTIDGSAINKDN
ncbi:hypothetical protein BDF19DRAFT_432493 [Syncephalis fuscata]|nr:hypothetical protein BDF19DRAFT_432493 [Syncephalis fuscata]